MGDLWQQCQILFHLGLESAFYYAHTGNHYIMFFVGLKQSNLRGWWLCFRESMPQRSMFSSTTLKVKSDPTVQRRSTEPRIEFTNQQRDHQRLQCNHLFLLINKSDGVIGTYLIHLGLLTFKLSLSSISMKQLCLLRLQIKVTGKSHLSIRCRDDGIHGHLQKKIPCNFCQACHPTARCCTMDGDVENCRNNNSEIIWFHRTYSKLYRTRDSPSVSVFYYR